MAGPPGRRRPRGKPRPRFRVQFRTRIPITLAGPRPVAPPDGRVGRVSLRRTGGAMGPSRKPQGAATEPGLAADLSAACEAAHRAAASLRARGGFTQQEADAVLDRCLAVSRSLTDR